MRSNESFIFSWVFSFFSLTCRSGKIVLAAVRMDPASIVDDAVEQIHGTMENNFTSFFD